MSILLFTIILFVVSFFAGTVGALTGLGGGVVIIPVLTLLFGVDIHYAIGASLISVIATSSGAAASYVSEGFSNIRIGIFLEIATTIGAVAGAFLAVYAPTHFIAVLFGIVLLLSAGLSFRKREENLFTKPSGKLSHRLKLNGAYPSWEGPVNYSVNNIPGGFIMMALAGIISGLLGIGSGALKVIALDGIMKLPFKVSTATSNFMIGVTASASAGVYLARGYIDPGLSLPVVLGVLTGALLGAKYLVKFAVKTLRLVFAVIITLLALEMIYNGVSGKL